MRTWDEINLVVEGGLSFEFPKMYKIQQTWDFPYLTEVKAALRKEFSASSASGLIKPGMKIAIAVGSRGIDQLPEVVKAIVELLKGCGAEPFVIPAMGSHGGGDSRNQAKILHSYGITEEAIGAPIESSMDTVEIGKLQNGTPLYCDKLAYESDGIIVVNRVKPHTSFRGQIESGLTKMMAIGLGKHRGATAFHRWGFAAMREMLMEAAPIFLSNAPILMGVALLENAYDKLSVIKVVKPDDWVAQEEALLSQARSMMPRLPLDDIDVLIVDEMGKNISGAGMDPNIINRAGSPAFIPSPSPRINKLVVLDLTDESGGNAIGVGVADLITRRLVDKINLSYMYANAITATVLAGSRIPMPLANDREAIAVSIKTCNAAGPVKIVRIKNTLELSEIWVSEGCLKLLENRSGIQVKEHRSMEFDESRAIFNFS